MSESVPQVFIGDGFDYTTSGTQPSEKGVAQAKANQVRLYDLKGDPPNIGRGEIIIYDFSLQGNNHPEGDFAHHANGYMSSTFWTAETNSLTPCPDHLLATSPAPSGTIVGQHSAYAFDRLFVAAGGGANVSLSVETSAVDGTLSPLTYTPGASICSLTPSLTNGAERLVVGRIGAAAQKMSTVTGTVAETMHADTNSMWGMIVSGLNGTDAGTPVQLIYSGTTIKTKATNADQTTALVATNPATTVNAGGFAIGPVKPGGRAQRAYWGIPKVSNTAGALKYTAEALMTIMSTDMTGADLLPHQSFYCPNGILGCVPFRLGLAYFDDTHVVYWDGDTEFDLGIFRQRVGTGADSYTYNGLSGDIRYAVRSLTVVGPDLYALTNTYNITKTGGLHYLERYKFETGTWHAASHASGPGIGGSGTPVREGYLCGQGGLGYSHTTHRIHAYLTDTSSAGGADRWYSFFVPRPGESLLWQYSQGSGTATSGIPLYSGTSTQNTMWMPNWWIDDYFPSAIRGTSSIKRLPKVITGTEFNGNLDYGGSAVWSFRMQCFGLGIDGSTVLTAYDQTYEQGKASADYKKRNPPTARANVQNMQWKLSLTCTGTTRKIPQLLPFTIRFAYSKDDKPITELPEDNVRR